MTLEQIKLIVDTFMPWFMILIAFAVAILVLIKWAFLESPRPRSQNAGMLIYVCNNEKCRWVGWESQTVHPKHTQAYKVCLECHETCETMLPEWATELMAGAHKTPTECEKCGSSILYLGRDRWTCGNSQCGNCSASALQNEVRTKMAEEAEEIRMLKEEVTMLKLVNAEFYDVEQDLYRELVSHGWVKWCDIHQDYCTATFPQHVIEGFRAAEHRAEQRTQVCRLVHKRISVRPEARQKTLGRQREYTRYNRSELKMYRGLLDDAKKSSDYPVNIEYLQKRIDQLSKKEN